MYTLSSLRSKRVFHGLCTTRTSFLLIEPLVRRTRFFIEGQAGSPVSLYTSEPGRRLGLRIVCILAFRCTLVRKLANGGKTIERDAESAWKPSAERVTTSAFRNEESSQLNLRIRELISHRPHQNKTLLLRSCLLCDERLLSVHFLSA